MEPAWGNHHVGHRLGNETTTAGAQINKWPALGQAFNTLSSTFNHSLQTARPLPAGTTSLKVKAKLAYRKAEEVVALIATGAFSPHYLPSGIREASVLFQPPQTEEDPSLNCPRHIILLQTQS